MKPKLNDAVWLREQYVDNRRTLESMAEEIGCNKGTVGRALRKFGIPARKRTGKYPQLDDREWLYDAYIVKRMSTYKIAEILGCAPGLISCHLKEKGIPARPVREGMEIAGRAGAQNTVIRLGSKAGNWRGGRRIMRNGYIYLYNPEHPKATKGGYVMEHRIVAESFIGRYLTPDEIVHHIDGNKQNNAIENLEVKNRGEHISGHFHDSFEVKRMRQYVAELEAQLAERDKEIALLKEQLDSLCHKH